MVPGHPPCALSSLIFSSLDPETNCLSRFIVVCSGLVPSLNDLHYSLSVPILHLLLRFATGLFRIFSLCSCQGAGCFFQGLNPENDTADSAFLFQALSFNSFPLTLCVFARPALWPSRSHSHASAASAAPLTDEFAWCLLVSAFAY